MTMRRMIATTTVLIAGAWCVALIAGCGAETKENEQSEQSKQPVDPRFATPEAIVKQYNNRITQDPPDIGGMLDFVYAENEFQQRVVSVLDSISAMLELHGEVKQRFGTGLIPEEELEDPPQPVTLDERNGERATASSQNNNETIHLVRYKNRWWVSGYTFEYDPEMSDREELTQLEKFAEPMGRVARDLIGRVQAGEFNSAAQVQQQLGLGIIKNSSLTPEELQNLPDDFGL